MFSGILKVMVALVSFSPLLLSLYLVKIYRIHEHLSFYIHLGNFRDLLVGFYNLLTIHYLLLAFLLVLFLTWLLIKTARNKLPVGRIAIKQIKPADFNFSNLLISAVLPMFKIYNPSISDKVFLIGYLLVGIGVGLAVKNSYHFNLTMKLFWRFNHYEVQTIDGVTFLVLSSSKIVNNDQFKQYVNLTDFMLLNITDQNKS